MGRCSRDSHAVSQDCVDAVPCAHSRSVRRGSARTCVVVLLAGTPSLLLEYSSIDFFRLNDAFL